MASKSEIDREEKGKKKRRNEAPNNGFHESSSKKKKENLKIIKNQEDSSTDDEESLPQEGKEVNIDFEGFTMEENDFHGIKMLLQQLFIMLPMNISELTDLLISQNYIGSVLKMTDDEEQTVYGISTFLDLHIHKEKDCVVTLLNSIKDKCRERANNSTEKLQTILASKIGLVINERFINIPVDVSLPMFSSLSSEISDAEKRGDINEVDYLLLITKTVALTNDLRSRDTSCDASSSSKGKSKNKKKRKLKEVDEADNLEFINFEDEIFYKESSLAFSYSVTKATGFAVSGGWDSGDNAMNTFRTIMFIKKSKLEDIIKKIESMIHG